MWHSLLNDMEVPETKRDTPLRDTAPLNTSSGQGFHVLRFDKPRPNYASSFDWTDGTSQQSSLLSKREGNWAELTFAKTSRTVTRDMRPPKQSQK